MKQNKQLTSEQYHQMMKDKYLKHDPLLMELANDVMNNSQKSAFKQTDSIITNDNPIENNDQKLLNINLTKLKKSQEKQSEFFGKHPELVTPSRLNEKRRGRYGKDPKKETLKKQELLAKIREEKKDQILLDSLNNIAESNTRLNYTLKMKKITPEDLKRTKHIRSHQDYFDVSKRYKRFDKLITKIFIATNISLGVLILIFTFVSTR